MKCPYCGSKVLLKSSLEIYRNDYGYVCVCSKYPDCNAYVGTHKKTLKPLMVQTLQAPTFLKFIRISPQKHDVM